VHETLHQLMVMLSCRDNWWALPCSDPIRNLISVWITSGHVYLIMINYQVYHIFCIRPKYFLLKLLVNVKTVLCNRIEVFKWILHSLHVLKIYNINHKLLCFLCPPLSFFMQIENSFCLKISLAYQVNSQPTNILIC